MSNLHLLALHAHPDDIEFQCAGALTLAVKAGARVTLATMTPGDCGSRELGAEAIAAVRRAEARRSAELLGADYHCLEFRDLSIVIDVESKRRVTEFLRRTRPDLVLTAPPSDYMDDHEATSRLVRDACFNASCPNYSTRAWDPAPATEHIPHLYYVDPVEGCNARGERVWPDFYVDVSSVFELKKSMLACHESQRAWLRAQHGVDEYLAMQQRFAVARGQECGAAQAEAFWQHAGHPYPRENRLAELLAEFVRHKCAAQAE